VDVTGAGEDVLVADHGLLDRLLPARLLAQAFEQGVDGGRDVAIVEHLGRGGFLLERLAPPCRLGLLLEALDGLGHLVLGAELLHDQRFQALVGVLDGGLGQVGKRGHDCGRERIHRSTTSPGAG